jgi:hypothetical protein
VEWSRTEYGQVPFYTAGMRECTMHATASHQCTHTCMQVVHSRIHARTHNLRADSARVQACACTYTSSPRGLQTMRADQLTYVFANAHHTPLHQVWSCCRPRLCASSAPGWCWTFSSSWWQGSCKR